MITVEISNVPRHHYLTNAMRKAFTTYVLKPTGLKGDQVPDEAWRSQVRSSLSAALSRAKLFLTPHVVRVRGGYNDGSLKPGPIIVLVECLVPIANSFSRPHLAKHVETTLRPFVGADTQILVHCRRFNEETDVAIVTPVTS